VIARILLSLAVVAVPIAVHGAEGPRRTPASTAKRTCEIETPTGSRLGGVRRCRTDAEREAAKQEARLTVDRVQAWKPKMTSCPPDCR
jgi:hypothetical protein